MFKFKRPNVMLAIVVGVAALMSASAANARPRVNHISVDCWTHNEIGYDEIYLTFNNVRVNMGDFRGRTIRTSTATVVLPSYPVTVKFYEDDGSHWWDTDDLWYTVVHNGGFGTGTPLSSGGIFHTFESNWANDGYFWDYYVTYDIWSIP